MTPKGRALEIVEDEALYAGDCFVIDRHHNAQGYPAFFYDGKKRTFVNAIANPRPGDVSRHLCGNRACVNPNHIVASSHAENMRDRAKHGAYGISPRDRNYIRKSNRKGVELAEMFGVAKSRISQIRNSPMEA